MGSDGVMDRDTFPSMVDSKLVDGKTLRQKIRHDKQLQADGDPAAPTMGALYYDARKKEYRSEVDPLAGFL